MISQKNVQTGTPTPSISHWRWLPGALFLLTLLGPLATGWLVLAGCDPSSINLGSTVFYLAIISGLSFAILGSFILVYRPGNRIGWLCLAMAFGILYIGVVDLYVPCGLSGTITAPGLAYAAWVSYSYGIFAVLPLFVLIPMLFPTGRFLSSRWLWFTISAFIVVIAAGTAMGLLPDYSQDNGFETFYPVESPFGSNSLPDRWYSFFRMVSVVSVNLLILVSIAAVIVRFRRSSGDEREQMKWLVYFFAVAIGTQILIFEIPGATFYPEILDSIWLDMVYVLVFLGFPLILAVAIFKYRLYAIDIVINRTLVYTGLTLAIILIYTLTVVGLGLFFQSDSLFISIIATALVAVTFQPLRDRLQRGINRFMFGQRDEPYAVLSRLSQQLQTTAVPAETLVTLVETIADTLKLPYAAIELLEQDLVVGQSSVGESVGEVVALPLSYQQEIVGRLSVSPRARGETFTPSEEQLLAAIAAQTGPVASATRLTLALQRSRENLVLAREEERRRIRRDLHDGLGPNLASQTLQLDAVLGLLAANDVTTASAHVSKLKGQTQQMVADIRRLVYELRPPALDELGLLEALRAHVAQMGETHDSLHVTIDAVPEPLQALPAAIEVAAYRIVLEGVTNTIRHAEAQTCSVRLARTTDGPMPCLVLTIQDDGKGLPDGLQFGVGLTSMRERAEELGGSCAIVSSQGGGTLVSAMLPFTVGGER